MTTTDRMKIEVTVDGEHVSVWVPEEQSVSLSAGGAGKRTLLAFWGISPEARQTLAIGLAPWLAPRSLGAIEAQIRAFYASDDHRFDIPDSVYARLAMHLAGNLAPLKAAE